jgi:hypothetical protein
MIPAVKKLEPTVLQAMKVHGDGNLPEQVMRHGVDYEKHRPVGNPKRKV